MTVWDDDKISESEGDEAIVYWEVDMQLAVAEPGWRSRSDGSLLDDWDFDDEYFS